MEHSSGVYDVAFSPDRLVAAAGFEGMIRVWDTQTVHLLKELDHGWWVTRVIFSPDGKYLASSSDDLKLAPWNGIRSGGWVVMIWNVSTGQVVLAFKGHMATCVEFSPTGDLLTARRMV